MDLDFKKEKRFFIKVDENIELSVMLDSDGNIRIVLDGANMLISPNGANSINIVLEKQSRKVER